MSDADVIDGTGPQPVTLLNGRTVTLRYGFRSMRRLEQMFGSLGEMARQQQAGGDGTMYEATAKMLACGMLHEHDGEGAPLTVDRLDDLLDPAKIDVYLEAATAALALAFPAEAEEVVAQGPPAGDVAAATDSPGAPGTTPPPSSSDAPTPSSG